MKTKKYVRNGSDIFFPQFFAHLCFCPTAIGQLRRQSPPYHQGLMKQICVGVLAASQRSVKCSDMGGAASLRLC